MGKWLAVGALALIALLVLLWKQLESSEATPRPTPVAQPAPVAPAMPAAVALPAPAPVPAPAPPPAQPPKLDPQSDEFFHKHDEVVVPTLMRSAVKCWENLPGAAREKFNRNQSIVLKFKQKIANGTVSINDVVVERSSIGDAALEACFIQQIRNTTWHDDQLPDWEQDDEIKLGPRTLKKYTRENIEYVGPEAPATPVYIRE